MAYKLHRENDRVSRSYFIFNFINQNERASGLHQRALLESKFTDTISYPDWTPDPAHVCLLGFDETNVCAIAIAWLSEHKPAALSKLIRFDHVYFFDPIENDDLITSVDLHFADEKRDIRKLNSATWAILRKFLIRRRPELAEEIESLERIIDNYHVDVEPDVQSILSQQKDAVGLALDFSKFDRKHVFSKFALPDEFDNVFDAYEDDGGLEDEAVLHDWSVFEGWNFTGVKKTVRTFVRKGEKLRIIIANKLPLERTTGVDLLYFTHTYKAYTLIQYKRMIPIKEGSSVFHYRPNKQFDAEVSRMKNILEKIRRETDGIDIDEELMVSQRLTESEFRLHENPFYFKYVKSDEFNPSGGALVSGRYVPLECHERFLQSPECIGAKGGRIIKWSDIKRYFSSTEFSTLVSNGWVGTNGISTRVLHEMVNEAINDGKSIVLAEHQAA